MLLLLIFIYLELCQRINNNYTGKLNHFYGGKHIVSPVLGHFPWAIIIMWWCKDAIH